MIDWDSWQRHVNYIIDTQGRYYGVGDADGNPLFTLPAPIDSQTPDQWMESADLALSFPARDEDGAVTRVAELLVTDSIRDFDPSGRIPVAEGDYMLLAAFPGEGGVVRRGGTITHCTADDPDSAGVPSTVTIHALSVMDVWHTVPAASWPSAWWAARPYEAKTDWSGIPFKTPRKWAKIELSTKTYFTWKNGQAGFVIRRLAQESLDAAMMSQSDPDGTRWVDDPYHVVEVPEVDNSPVISLEARDGFLWETVAAQAKNAGVILGARVWWPGDPPVRCWNQARSTMRPDEVDISPSQGESKRTLGYRSFPHAMVVLTVKEVANA